MKKLKEYYDKQPLKVILFVALILRLVSAIFSQGYGMHDDHFLIIESSRSMVDGHDYQYWFVDGPQGHSLTYPAIMYFFFKLLKFIGIVSLNSQMYVVRIVHALFSLLIIYFSYKITYRLSNDKKISNYVAWFLSLLWCMPWLSVRNLVEIVCIPFLLSSTWLYIRNNEPNTKEIIYSGILMGLAFAFRYQVIFFIGGFGLAMLIYKQYKQAVIWSIALIITFCISQITDIFMWKKPFAEMLGYITYNATHSKDYITGGFFNYIGVILGVLVPPLSVFILFGYFYGYKRLFVFLPSFCFLLFHSIFPNKQERFIFPILPFIVILGVIGVNEFFIKHANRVKLKKVFKVCLKISIVINVILLIPVTVHYSKSARVESMKYLRKYNDTAHAFIVEDRVNHRNTHLPRTYAGGDIRQYNVIKDTNLVCDTVPAFIIFVDSVNLEERKEYVKKYAENLEYETTIYPNTLDQLMQKINRHNRNLPLLIYRNVDEIPEKRN